jgi:hypothetical protein
MERIVAQQLFGRGKLLRRELLLLLFGGLTFLLLLGILFMLEFHTQAVGLKSTAKALRARCSFPRTASVDCSVSVPTSS